ncbi:lipocalin family protein [Salegentibacter sp. HM20]
MKNATIILLLSLAVTSCTPKIVGSWNIDRYEIDNYKGENLSARNAGDIQINKNGTGQKNLSIKFFDRQSGQSESFRWDYKDQILRIYDVDSRQSSDFAKS